MEIETKKSAQFKTAVIDAINTEPEVTQGFEITAAKWAKELVKETFEGAVNCRKYFNSKKVEFAVTISLAETDDSSTDSKPTM